MKKEISLDKIFNNRVLFLLPNLMCLAYFSYCFNANYKLFLRGGYEVLFSEVITWSLIYIILISILHLLLRKKVSSYNLFLLKIILLTLFFGTSQITKYSIIIVCLIAVILKNNVKKLITYLSAYMIFCIFLLNFIPATYRTLLFTINTKSSDITKDIVIEKHGDKPNIYWIHCDGMVSLSTAEKYFEVDATSLRNYLSENDYYSNENATLVAAHHTMQALVALYNPYYYDEFFEEYLNTLEETYYDENAKVSYYVDYYDLRDRRMENELFTGLKKAGYKIATITEFNQYSSFYADYIYDYYNINATEFPIKQIELKYYKSNNNSIDMINNAVALEHFKTLGKHNLLGKTISETSILNYDVLDYDSFDYSNYETINNSDFSKSKAIIKSLNHLYEQTNDKKFVFIDFSINHAPWFYDENGKVSNSNWGTKEALSTTYYHSMYLLEDMLDYIKEKDSNAIIVLQGDHGVHVIPGDTSDGIYNLFGADETDARLLRNSTFNAVYIPEEYRTEADDVLGNPLNISRYLINNFVGNNYEYRE